MSKHYKTVIKVLISIGLAVVVLYFTFKTTDFDEFFSKIWTVNYWWIFLTMFLSLFVYVLRAYRWKLQLQPLGYSPSNYHMFLAVMSGYLANLLLPRLGEVTRCGVLYKNDEVPVSVSFGSVVTERVVDMLCLAVITLLAFLFESDQIAAFLGETINTEIDWRLIIVILVAVGGTGAFVFFKWIYPSQTKVGEFSRGLVAGFISLKDVHVGKFVFLSVAIWTLYFLVSYLAVFSMVETSHLEWETGFSILTAGTIAFVLPVQSGFGTFHAMVAAMLMLYGVDELSGKFFATLLHSSQLLAVLVYGLVALILTIFARRNDKRQNS